MSENYVPVGTAGTATIQGQVVRVIRAEEGRWISATRVWGEHWHQERTVTDFVPDVVVDEALIERVARLGLAFDGRNLDERIGHGSAIKDVLNMLRGQS